ncbi:helix-turn-helix domain-containing protein [Chitinophaga lutea]
MQEDIIRQISALIREHRKSKGLTAQDLASKAGVSKALISQIEHERTIPSLQVLLEIIRALGLPLHGFFEQLTYGRPSATRLFIRRAGDGLPLEKPVPKGFQGKRLFSRTLPAGTADIVLLELEPGAKQPRITVTEAWIFLYIIRGSVEYRIGNETVTFSEGDAAFFDGRQPHRISNTPVPSILLTAEFGEA